MGTLTLVNMADKVKYVQFLHDASEIRFSVGNNDVSLQLPIQKPQSEIPVLEVYLK
jgi:alpha-L-fucosidase